MLHKPTIVFFGTPAFALESLKALHQAGYPLLAVFTQPDKPQGRGKKIKVGACAEFAHTSHIPLFQPVRLKNNQEVLQTLRDLKPDFLVVAAYGKILPDEILQIPRIAAINVHASLLPKLRGAAPINWAILEGDTQTGVSLMYIVSALDAGPVYAQLNLDIAPTDTAGTLTPQLAKLGAKLLIEKLHLIAEGKLTATPQNESQMTLAPPLKKEMGKINWEAPAETIARQVRAFHPWPAAHTFIDNKRLKIYDGLVLNEKSSAAPGTVAFLSPQGLSVACGSKVYCIREVQLEGKKRMQASEFARGYRLQIGKKLL